MASVPTPFLEQLADSRRRYCFPIEIRPAVEAFSAQVLGLLFPHFAAVLDCDGGSLTDELQALQETLGRLQGSLASRFPELPLDLPERFAGGLPEVHRLLVEDAEALYHGDPAARSVDEVMLTYPGFHAACVYRIAHLLAGLGLPLVPRLLTELAHQRTGVDIHPGAKIGRRFAIDHGTGVVIGETTVIGTGVRLYQGVTLGALVVEKGLDGKKRHPTLEDHVVVYSGASILGGETVIGHDSIVAGNAFLTQSIPPFSVVSRRGDVRPRSSPDATGLEFYI